MKLTLSRIILAVFSVLMNCSLFGAIMGQSDSADIQLQASRYKINRLAPDQTQDETRIVIDGGGTIRIEITALIGLVQTSIVTPSGQILTPGTISGFGGTFTQLNAASLGQGTALFLLPELTNNFHYIYEFPALGEGEYVVKFQAPTGLNQEVPLLTQVDWNSNIVASLVPTDPIPVVGRPTVISAVLFNGAQPISGANVTVKIRKPDGTRASITLLDSGDGQADDRVGDGVYSGLFTPLAVGTHSLVGVATGKIPSRFKFSSVTSFVRNSLAELTARPAASQFTGTVVDRGVDDTADGLFDRIEFRIGTQTVMPGDYQAFIELKTAGGQKIVGSGAATLTPGPGEIIVNVPASVVREANENGPYSIETIRLDQITEADGSQEVDRRINLGQTLPYLLSQFQRPPLILTGVFTEDAIDTNGNGKYDVLRVSVQVDVLRAGLYDWNMQLTNSDFQDINFASAQGNLSAGLNNIVVNFDGAHIRRSESDGPYTIGNLLLFGPDSIVGAEIGLTRAYHYIDFEDGGPNVSITLAPAVANNLRVGQTHTLNIGVTQGTSAVANRIVTLRILSGPNSGYQFSQTTAANGSATFTYTGIGLGTDILRASVNVNDFLFNSNTATATWVNNSPPVCSAANASFSLITPPDNRLVPISILGLTDPDGDPMTVSFISVRQDEPTNHLGAGQNTPDAVIQGSNVLLKAERIFGTIVVNGTTFVGDGRVYHVTFTASDGRGGQCNGAVTIGVPHVRTASPIDGGALFDSTIP